MKALERIARKMAAAKMGLVEDPDGLRLPDDLWKQYLQQAARDMAVAEVAASLFSATLIRPTPHNHRRIDDERY